MKITTTAEAFVAALKNMRVDKKHSIPVLTHVKLSGNTMMSTDLDISVITQYDAKGEGEVLIPYKQALAVLDHEKGPLEISVEKSKKPKKGELPEQKPVRLKVSGCEYTFVQAKLANFPELPKLAETTLEVNGEDFRTLLERTRFAICNVESRYTLNGILLKANADELIMVGTDGHRLSLASLPMDVSAGFQTLIHSNALDYLRTRLGETVKIGMDDHHQIFKTGNVTVIARKLTGQFPNYEAVFPRAPKIKVQVSTKIEPILKRVAKCVDERSGCLKFTFGPTSSIYASSIDRGTATAPLPVVSDGEITIGWNSEFILDFLKVVGDKPFEISLTDNQSAAVFSIDNFKHIVMPMRL